MKLHFQIITLFPQMIESNLQQGIVAGAIKKNILKVSVLNPREVAEDNHKTIDDRPFGGGDGMVMMYEPLMKLCESHQIPQKNQNIKTMRRVYLSPQGQILTSQKAQELSKYENLVFFCGRYGGIDQRFLNEYVDEEISIGDYVVSGGEIPALILLDAVARFVPGVLGNSESAVKDSFSNGLLEAPVFTRPSELQNAKVPDTLTSGNHEKINEYRKMLSLLVTLKKRPELLLAYPQTDAEIHKAHNLYLQMSETERSVLGLENITEDDFDYWWRVHD